MTMAMRTNNSYILCACHNDLPHLRTMWTINWPFGIWFRKILLILIGATLLAALALSAKSQPLDAVSEKSSSIVENPAPAQLNETYIRPSQKTMLVNYVFDAYGPYPIVGAGIVAAYNQLGNSPPEWNQGSEGFGKRFGSDFAIAVVGTTTRFGLSEAFKEDALYYRCECRGFLPRLSHAALSTFTARRGEDGHRVFSIPALVGPYTGSMTAIYSWYPDRFGAKDAIRMGNYNLLIYMAGNISLEFFYGGPHSLFSRIHLNNSHGSKLKGPNN